jgi:dolichyl-phosphate beta-glucosyltransferase
MQEICLVIPCYNEAKRLRVQDFVACLKDRAALSICLVNDGSSDGTAAVLDGLRRNDPDRILVLTLAANRGKAEAVRQGVLHVAASRRYALVGYWDADLSTPLGEVDLMLQELAKHPGCQLAMGSRIKRLGSEIDRRAKRHVLGRVFATFASLILGLPVYDSQCGAKLFRAESIDILFRDPFITRWLFDVEIIARLRNHIGTDGVLKTTIEVPLNTWIEVGGSKLHAADMIRVPMELLQIRAHYNRDVRRE